MKYTFYIIFVLNLFSCNHHEKQDEQLTKPNDSISVHEKDSTKSDRIEVKILNVKHPQKFENYKVKVYDGKLTSPNFKNNPFADDKEYVQFITKGCDRLGINYNGQYTIITKSCGAQCSHLFIIDRVDGRIFTDIKPNDGRYGYEFRKDSKLLIANAGLFIDSEFENYVDYWCEPEYYIWNKNNFELIK
jgi:hypothetical protein